MVIVDPESPVVTPKPDPDPTPNPNPNPTPTSPPSSLTVKWPIEILGAHGVTETVQFVVPDAAQASAANRVWFKTHNLTYDNKMEFSLNGGSWTAVANGNALMRKMDRVAGGFGGGHSTHAFSMSLPGGQLKSGVNTIQFKFISRAGERSSGYRVLRFNFLRADGSRILDENIFVEDAPQSWGPVLTSSGDIAEGKRLWDTANLTHPAFPAGHIIRAKCADCHAQDGRDLKYFNYSNKSIVERSKFHGLTEQQGKQIASYIRTLAPAASAGGRPWNPPYQPGPGIDSRPVYEWGAGAGESAVLEDFDQMYPHLFPEAVEPNGTVNPAKVTGARLDSDTRISMREIPIPMQFPDWNSWLPSIHPVDATGDFFLRHAAFARYKQQKGKAPANVSMDEWFFFQNDISNYTKIDNWPNFPATGSHNLSATPRHSLETYDAALWGMVKAWEITQEKDLESYSATFFPKVSRIPESPSWYTNMAFFTSPNMMGLPAENHGIRNGTKVTRFWFAWIWYHVQAVLYAGQGLGIHIAPLDWDYVNGFLANMPQSLDRSAHEIKPAPLFHLWLSKGVQLANNGVAPASGFNNTPQLHLNHPRHLIGAPSIEHLYFSNKDLYVKSIEIQTREWLDLIQKWTPEQWRANERVGSVSGFAYPANQPQINNLYYSQNILQQAFYVSWKLRQLGASASLNQRMKAVLQPVFPQPGIPWNQF